MDEIIQIWSTQNELIKLKRITSVSPEIWQSYNENIGRWEVIKEAKRTELIKKFLVQERQVLIEKKGNGT